MSSIPQVSLEDTYTLMQLVRETALAKGRTEQADQLTPVVNEMRSVVSSARTTSSVPASTGVLGQADGRMVASVLVPLGRLSGPQVRARVEATERLVLDAAVTVGAMNCGWLLSSRSRNAKRPA